MAALHVISLLGRPTWKWIPRPCRLRRWVYPWQTRRPSLRQTNAQHKEIISASLSEEIVIQILKAAEPLEFVKRFMSALVIPMGPSDLWEQSPAALCLTMRESNGISLAIYLLRGFISSQQGHLVVDVSFCNAGAERHQVFIEGCTPIFLAVIRGCVPYRGHCVCGRFVGGAGGSLYYDEYED